MNAFGRMLQLATENELLKQELEEVVAWWNEDVTTLQAALTAHREEWLRQDTGIPPRLVKELETIFARRSHRG